MTIQTNVVRRGAVYYHRVAVPADLRRKIGRREIWRSLRTKEPSDARRLGIFAGGAALELFGDVRRAEMTKDEIAAHVRQFYERDLEADARERRAATLSAADLEMKAEGLRLHEAELRSHLAQNQFALVQDFADEIIAPEAAAAPFELHDNAAPVMERPAASIDRTSAAYRELCQGLLRARLEVARRMIERCEGDWTGEPADPLLRPHIALAPITPATPVAAAPAKPAPSFEELLDRFFAEKKGLVPKYVKEFRDSIDWMRDYFGRDKPITAYTEEDMVEYKDALIQLPANYRKFFKGASFREAVELNKTAGRPTLSATSINNKRLGNPDSFFEWCRKNKVIRINPAKEIRVDAPKKGKRAKKRDPFTTDQLTTMFSAPMFTGCKSEAAWKEPGEMLVRNHRFWLPLLGLWTGGRQGELAQLLTSDVKEIDGVLCILITDDESDDDEATGHGKRVKNEESKRVVPVHPELRKLGFVAYVEAQRKAGHARLFSDCKLGADGSYSPFSKHFRRFLDSVNITKRGRVVFHSFRHSFQDAMREAGLSDSVQDALAGRTSRHSSEEYGRGYKPPRLLAEIEKVRFPGLDLSHLHC